MIIVRIPKRLRKRWLSKHYKDGLDEYKLVEFIETEYSLGSYERGVDGLLLFVMRFKKKSRAPMKASLYIREKKTNGFIELILIRGHVEEL